MQATGLVSFSQAVELMQRAPFQQQVVVTQLIPPPSQQVLALKQETPLIMNSQWNQFQENNSGSFVGQIPQQAIRNSLNVQDPMIQQTILEMKKRASMQNQIESYHQNEQYKESSKSDKKGLENAKMYLTHRDLKNKDAQQIPNHYQTQHKSEVRGQKEQFFQKVVLVKDEVKKLDSQHRNELSNMCSQKKNCACPTCQLKFLYTKFQKINVPTQQTQSMMQSQEKAGSQLILKSAKSQSAKQRDCNQLPYSTLQNSKDQSEQSAFQNQVNAVNVYFENPNTILLNHSQKEATVNQQQYISQNKEYSKPQIKSGLNMNNLYPPTQLKIQEDTLVASNKIQRKEQAILKSQKDQHISENNSPLSYKLNNEINKNHRDTLFSQMYEQNTQLQQLVQDQQTYIQLLYNQMISYQNILDVNKIPYNTVKNISSVPDSFMGSTAAPSPVISQICHSARTSDLGYSESTESPLQEFAIQAGNLAHQKINQQQILSSEISNPNQLQPQNIIGFYPHSTNSLVQQNQLGILPATNLSNCSQIYNTSNIEGNSYLDGVKLSARSANNMQNSQLSIKQPHLVGQQKNNVNDQQNRQLFDERLRQDSGRSKSIYKQLNIVSDRESLSDHPNMMIKSSSLSTRSFGGNSGKLFLNLPVDMKINQHEDLHQKRFLSQANSKQTFDPHILKQTNSQTQSNNLPQVMEEFKQRFATFLNSLRIQKQQSSQHNKSQSLKNQLTAHHNHHNNQSINNSLQNSQLIRTLKNNVKNSQFMSPQCSPTNKYNKQLEKLLYGISLSKQYPQHQSQPQISISEQQTQQYAQFYSNKNQ